MSRIFEDFFDDIELTDNDFKDENPFDSDMKIHINMGTYIDFNYKMFKTIKVKELVTFFDKFKYVLDNSYVIRDYKLIVKDEYDNDYTEQTYIDYVNKSFDESKEYSGASDGKSYNIHFSIVLNINFLFNKPYLKKTFNEYYNAMTRLYTVCNDFALKIDNYEIETEQITKELMYNQSRQIQYSVFKLVYFLWFYNANEHDEEVLKQWNNKTLPFFELKEMPKLSSKSKKKSIEQFNLFDVVYSTSNNEIVSQKTDYPIGFVINKHRDYITISSFKMLSLDTPDAGSRKFNVEITPMAEKIADYDKMTIDTGDDDGRQNQIIIYNYINAYFDEYKDEILKNFDMNWKKGPLTDECTDTTLNVPMFVSLMRFKTKGSLPGQWRLPCYDELFEICSHEKAVDKAYKNTDYYNLSFALRMTSTLVKDDFLKRYKTCTVTSDKVMTEFSIHSPISATPVLDIKI